jgi:hypothetical protein
VLVIQLGDVVDRQGAQEVDALGNLTDRRGTGDRERDALPAQPFERLQHKVSALGNEMAPDEEQARARPLGAIRRGRGVGRDQSRVDDVHLLPR